MEMESTVATVATTLEVVSVAPRSSQTVAALESMEKDAVENGDNDETAEENQLLQSSSSSSSRQQARAQNLTALDDE
jgi:hypothetical protein